MKTIVLLPFFAALLCAGCANPVLSPAGPETRSRVLIVHIAGESRTALPPTPSPSTYTISVGRSSAGDLGFRDGFSASDTEFSVPLSDYPKAGDTVVVEGFDSSNVKCAEGSYVLTGPETSVIITLCPSQTETGKVDLSVSFPDTSFPADQEITAAELSLYRSLAEYQEGTVYKFTRYRKDGNYGAGKNLGSSIPIEYDNLPSGNYVVKIEFFRFKFVRVSTLIQTIIVRDGLTTNSWDGAGSDTLNWGADKFASSNANLSGISIGGTSVNNFSSTTYSYSEYGTGAPSNKTLAVTPGTQGQTIAVSLNGSPVTNNSLTGMNAVNSIVITVTAPDGFTQQTYTVSYTYQYATEWYVSSASSTPPGNDSSGNGSQTQPYASVTKVLSEISTAYAAAGSTWPGGSSAPVAARINISGTITEA
ncbi:MAG: cadherin-like beta sandwich domain-containing protein, partial [Treponema sp.]|nr:cadherin-like beta sandwich domain-containing protein [Treponema sp.]